MPAHGSDGMIAFQTGGNGINHLTQTHVACLSSAKIMFDIGHLMTASEQKTVSVLPLVN